MAASAYLYPKQDVLVIDLGSCITYDLLNRDGIHQGGSSRPGFERVIKVLHHYSRETTSIGAQKKSKKTMGDQQNQQFIQEFIMELSDEIKGVIELIN